MGVAYFYLIPATLGIFFRPCYGTHIAHMLKMFEEIGYINLRRGGRLGLLGRKY